MNLIDVNVLVAMFDGDHVHHDTATQWWQAELDRGQPFTVPDLVWVGFARLATNTGLSWSVATFAEAWAFAQAVMAQPTYLRFVPDPRTLTEFERLASESNARADLVTDSYIAACASAYGATVVTFDRDFRKFDGIRTTELAT